MSDTIQKAIRTKWLDMLKSGEYTQCLGKLKDLSRPNTYCAMGLLVEAATQVTGKNFWSGNDLHEVVKLAGVVGLGRFRDRYEVGRVMEYMGLWLSSTVSDVTVANLNDSGVSFKAIAYIIEHAELQSPAFESNSTSGMTMTMQSGGGGSVAACYVQLEACQKLFMPLQCSPIKFGEVCAS